jgi:histidinol-phosphate aminotransferase
MMKTNRRNWLRNAGLVAAGLGMVQFKTAAAIPDYEIDTSSENDPIRLSSNENPYGPSPEAVLAMKESIRNSNRYNWNSTTDLISAIAKKNKATPDNILVGAGSTEIIDTSVQFFALQKGSFIVASPSYTSWAKAVEKTGFRKITVPLSPDKKHDLTGMLQAIEPDTKMIYLCNPNNPTGTICETEALISFIRAATKKVTVVVDEAYLDFTNQPSLSNLAVENRNLVVVKTFSKIHGLAGARIGYAIAHTETIQLISQQQTWANGGISVASRAAAMASLKDEDFTKKCFALNQDARRFSIEQLEKLNITCIPSHTNFIYFSLTNYKKDFFSLLKDNNIQGTGIYEENGKWTRITVGTMEEMQKFIVAIK